MDAVVIAGGIPRPNEPLYRYSKGDSKALIDVAGKPMIQWVLDALGAAKRIERVVVVGLSDKSGLSCKKPLSYLSNQGRILENLKAGTARVMELNPKAKYVLIVSSDIPGITGGMVDWVIETCLQTKDDLYYNIIYREDMERRFPGSKRTFTSLKDMQVCGGDMNVVRTSIVSQNSDFWTRVLDARKNPAAQASLIGPDIIFKYIFRQLTVDDVIQRLSDKLDIKGRAVFCPYPEIGMDIDKPHQLELVRSDLTRQLRKSGASVGAPARRKTAAKKAKPARKSTAARKRKPAAKSKPAKKAPARKSSKPKTKSAGKKSARAARKTNKKK